MATATTGITSQQAINLLSVGRKRGWDTPAVMMLLAQAFGITPRIWSQDINEDQWLKAFTWVQHHSPEDHIPAGLITY